MTVLTSAVSLALVAMSAHLQASRAHRAAEPIARIAARVRSDPPNRVASANRRAMLEPSSTGFASAVQVYPWSEGALYRLITAPGIVSDVALQPGEGLVSVAAGDTARWVIGDTASGTGAARRTHILIKPIASGLKTNLVITTDRRVYLIALQSRAGEGMAAVSWTYPEDGLIALSAAAATPVAQGVEVDRLDFNYRIEGDRAPWMPIRAFDDGTQTFIQFPLSVSSGEIPPLFVIGSSGRAELVNYRLSGRYYVVGRLFSRAELRLGGKHQLIVRIFRTDAKRPGRAE